MPDSFSPIAQTVKHLDKVQTVFEVTLGTPNTHTGRYTFHVLNADNEVLSPRTGDLLKRARTWTLTAGQKTALAACVTVEDVMLLTQNYVATKAQGSIG